MREVFSSCQQITVLIYFPLHLVYLVICWCFHNLHVIWHNYSTWVIKLINQDQSILTQKKMFIEWYKLVPIHQYAVVQTPGPWSWIGFQLMNIKSLQLEVHPRCSSEVVHTNLYVRCVSFRSQGCLLQVHLVCWSRTLGGFGCKVFAGRFLILFNDHKLQKKYIYIYIFIKLRRKYEESR